MKTLKIALVLLIFLFQIPDLFAQTIPQNPNKTDNKGLRQGKWTITFDSQWLPTTLKDSIKYYRLIAYKDGKPEGMVTDFYLSGKKQFEGRLLSDNPKEIKEGVCTWYYENGQKSSEITYVNGQQQGKEVYYSKNGEYTAEIVDKKESEEDKALEEIKQAYQDYADKKYATALPIFEKYGSALIEIYQKEGQKENIAALAQILITCYEQTGQQANADKLKPSLATYKENSSEWKILNEQGMKLYQEGKYEQAIQIFEKAKTQAEKEFGKEHSSYATSLNNLAALYQSQGLYAKTEPLMIEAKEIDAKVLGKEHPSYATSLNNLAALYERQGLYAKAEPLYIEAKEIRAKTLGREHPDYAASCNNLAGLYKSQGLYAKAEPLMIEAKEIYAKILGKEHSDYATSCDNLAGLYKDQGLYAKAEPLYVEAKEIRAKALGKEHPDYAGSCNNLAGLYESQGLYAKAEPLFIESKDIALKSLLNNFSNLSEGEKKQFFDADFFYFENFYALITTILQKEPTYKGLPNLLQSTFDLQLNTKGLLLAESQKMKKRILSSGDKDLIAKFEAWGALKNTIAKAYNLSVADRAKQGLAMPQLESEANELEKQLSARSEDFKRAFTPPTVTYQDIQKHLKEGEVAIEMIRTKYKNQETDEVDTAYLALVLTPKDLFPVLLKNGKDLEGKILKKYRNNIKFKMVDTVSYRAFWQPIAEKLAGAKKVYFSPDGAYNSLNINTLFNPTTKKYIVDEYDISILTNLKEMVAQKKPNTTKKANLFGRPAYKMKKDEHEDNRRGIERGETSETESSFNITQMGFSDLVGTEVEVKGIDSVLRKNTWQTELILGKQALEERVKKVKNPAILHIATHGYFVPSDGKSVANAMLNSGIVLAGVSSDKGANSEDGVLTAYEASGLDLDETNLVVLSACETGLGEVSAGEGVYGLQRGFKVAGAKAVIMSLWKVDDTATQELMNTFYSLWLSGKSKKEAFKAAQLKLKAKYQAPYYWGAFVMVGE